MAEDAGLEALRDMFRYHAWATLRLIDFCAGLPPDQLQGSVPGTRGPILTTFEHIIASDHGYKMRFGVTSESPIEEGGGATLARMRDAFARESETWQSLLDRLWEFDFTVPAKPDDDPP